MDVKEKHYDGVEDLTLDGNKLEDLKKIEKKLLNIPLGMRFSARNNRLTSVSFFLSNTEMTDIDCIDIFFRFRMTCHNDLSRIQTSYFYHKTHGDVHVIVKSTTRICCKKSNPKT